VVDDVEKELLVVLEELYVLEVLEEELLVVDTVE